MLLNKLITFLFIIFGFASNIVIASQNTIANNSEFVIEEEILNRKKLNLVKVSAKGIGNSLQEAKDDAAVNAITKVVGSYFDTSKTIKKTKIYNKKITQKFKEISKEYFIYNRGNIYNFEVSNVEKKGEIFYINAVVEVSKKNIENYVEEYTSDESIIGLEINTIRESRVQNVQQRNQLLSNLFERKNNISYQYITHGKGQLLENFSFIDFCKESLKDRKNYCDIFLDNFNLEKYCFFECIYSDKKTIVNELDKFKTVKEFKKPYNILVLPFKISMSEDYKEIYNNLFSEMSLNENNIKYLNNNLIEFSNLTNDFIKKNQSDNNSRYRGDRLIIFNHNKDSYLKSFYIRKTSQNQNLYSNLFTDIIYKEPALILTIKDKFKNTKYLMSFSSASTINSSVGICGNNQKESYGPKVDCNKFEVKEAKIISVLNDLPISNTNEISIVNATKNEYFIHNPLVVNSENNFLLLLNLDKFNLEKEDSISLQFESSSISRDL